MRGGNDMCNMSMNQSPNPADWVSDAIESLSHLGSMIHTKLCGPIVLTQRFWEEKCRFRMSKGRELGD